jgi:hypothetical protein
MPKVLLASGSVAPDSPISVQLIKPNHGPESRASVLITWPAHVTECTPAKLADVVTNACRILSNGSSELARRKIEPRQP